MASETTTETEDPTGRAVAEIEVALAASDWRKVYDITNRAISRGLRHPLFFMMRAQRMEETGHLQFALEDYQRAAAIAPDDARIHEAVGLCALKQKNYKTAVAAYDAALRAGGATPDIYYRRGVALANLGDHESAQASHEQALALDPNYANALGSLASITARKGELDKARQFAKDALSAAPQHPTAVVATVQADMSERRFTDAEAKLSELLAGTAVLPANRPALITMLGDTLDGQKRYAEAFATYTRANDELRRLHAADFGGGLGSEAARNLVVYFENEKPERWRAPDDGGAIEGAFEGHVFLLGFMRSGTTLLEQVLASNPEIVALEEKGLLAQPGDQYLSGLAELEDLANIDGENLAKARREYWQRVRGHLPESKSRIFVDKQPLNTTKLPLIAKLFPKARILFAVRDPRDVVFSCFRRHLNINATQYEFLSIESCARMYGLVMRLGEIGREKLPLNVLEHRYEAMVEDFDGRVRAVCDFIGVEWAETMREFDKQTSVADLRSPSATQVRRPLYGEGIGQWRRYAEQLAPVLPILEPWVEKFGYPID
ncbi:MAG TPA: sulfotransferase [Rhizomicrobium sp.]|nr:sulfotransferase [Rhizomicrobium sp.]